MTPTWEPKRTVNSPFIQAMIFLVILDNLLAFWERSSQFRKYLRPVCKEVIRSSIRPYPIDLYMNRERCGRLELNYFFFKNGVIKAVKKLRRNNRKSFLQNLKSELINKRRKELN